MKSPANFRLMAFVVLVVLLLGLAAQNSLAQTVSVSPVALSYGVPTGTPVVAPCMVPCSAQETVTVNITGASPSSPVMFGTTSVTGTNSADFTTAGDSCTGQTFTSPATCLVTLYFNAKYYNSTTPPPSTLETATLTLSITSGATAPPPVPLSGAYGAIKLWDETNEAVSVSTASFTDLYTIASTTQNLICPTSPTATISNTPDGNGYVLVDNYLTLAISGTPVTIAGSNPPGNVCIGGPADSYGENSYNDCFSTYYQNDASGLSGEDPDTFTNPNNSVLGDNPGGVPPINVSSYFTSSSTPVPVSFTALDAGGYYTSSTLFLATNCSPAGIVPGGSVTGNSTPTNTASFDNNPGSSFSITDSSAQNPPPTGTTPVYTQIAVPQQLFQQLVAGTSAATDVCFRLNSELDYSVNPPAPMCAGVLIQCWNPAQTSLSGANCDPSTPSQLRNLFFSMSFDSLDGPANGTNYLYNSPTNACSYYMTGGYANNGINDGTCATGTGPGLLLGADQWLCAPGSTIPPNAPNPPGGGCTPLEPNTPYASPLTEFNTQTSPSVTIYSSLPTTNCNLSGLLAGDLCPLDTLTQFRGAADLPPAGNKGNSTYIPVANHPLPTATATIAGQNSSGWINSSTISATFNSYEASYTPGGTNPPLNGFTAAPIYSLTYGISTWPALPDTTYPVTGDVTNYPASGVNPNFVAPLCPSAPISFTSSSSGNLLFSSLSDGIYNVHYFPTDCALTEGLVFNPQGGALTNPTTNWASFPFVTVGIDTVAPTLTSCTPPTPNYLGGGGWYGGNITVSCTVTDPPATDGSYSGFGSPGGPSGIQGNQTETVNVYTNVALGTTNAAAYAGAQNTAGPSPLAVTDLAGNPLAVGTGVSSGGVLVGPYQIDLQAPTIMGPTLSAGPYYVNQPITVTFSCSDLGSGVAACSGTGGVVSGGTVTPVAAGPYTFTVTATDNVGNHAASSVNYTATLAPQTITAFTGPTSPQVYGTTGLLVSATASSGLPVSFMSLTTGVCTVAATTGTAAVTLTGTGTCTIEALQGGNSNYSAVSPSPTLSFTVTPTVKVTPTSLIFATATTPLYPGQIGPCSPNSRCEVTVTNPGPSSVQISSVTIGGTNSNYFGVLSFLCTGWSTKGGTLAPRASCPILVDAWLVPAPASTSASPFVATAYLAITPKGGSAVDVPLTTYVINPVANFSSPGHLSSGKLTFPTTATNKTSELSITVTNTGTTPLIFRTPTVSSSTGYFTLTSTTCTDATIEPASLGSSECVINVTFAPKTTKTVTGTLTIPNNAENSPQTISLSGTAN